MVQRNKFKILSILLLLIVSASIFFIPCSAADNNISYDSHSNSLLKLVDLTGSKWLLNDNITDIESFGVFSINGSYSNYRVASGELVNNFNFSYLHIGYSCLFIDNKYTFYPSSYFISFSNNSVSASSCQTNTALYNSYITINSGDDVKNTDLINWLLTYAVLVEGGIYEPNIDNLTGLTFNVGSGWETSSLAVYEFDYYFYCEGVYDEIIHEFDLFYLNSEPYQNDDGSYGFKPKSDSIGVINDLSGDDGAFYAFGLDNTKSFTISIIRGTDVLNADLIEWFCTYGELVDDSLEFNPAVPDVSEPESDVPYYDDTNTDDGYLTNGFYSILNIFAGMINSFTQLFDFLFVKEVMGLPLISVLLGSGLLVVVGWVVVKWVIPT